MPNASPDVAPPPPDPIELEVRGRPVPKGAVRGFVVPGKSGKRARAVIVQGGSKAARSNLNEWQSAIQDAALVAMGARELEVARFVGMAVEVEVLFRLARPKAHYGTGRNAGVLKLDAPPFPIGTPDVDKLARTVLDALIGSAFDDDSRVVDLHPRKVYAAAGQVEGARIRIRAAVEHEAPILALVPSCGVDRLGLSLLEAADAERTGGQLTIANVEAATAAIRNAVPPPPVEIVSPEEKKRRAQDRIRRTIAGNGGPMAAELAVYGKNPTHAIAKHTPPAIDEDAAAAINRGESDYRERVLGQPRLVPTAADQRHAWSKEILDPKTTNERRRELVGLLSIPQVRPPDDVDDFGGPDL